MGGARAAGGGEADEGGRAGAGAGTRVAELGEAGAGLTIEPRALWDGGDGGGVVANRAGGGVSVRRWFWQFPRSASSEAGANRGFAGRPAAVDRRAVSVETRVVVQGVRLHLR